MKTPRRKALRIAREIAIKVIGCRLRDLRGECLEDLLLDLDGHGGVSVYWGCFTDEILKEVV